MAAAALGLTSAVIPLRAFPLITIVSDSRFRGVVLGMWGAAGSALVDVTLIDTFLTRTQLRFATGNPTERIRLGIFLSVSLLLGWSMRRLSEQRAELKNQELRQKLILAETERRLAEEWARASEALWIVTTYCRLRCGRAGWDFGFGTSKRTVYTDRMRSIGWWVAIPDLLMPIRRVVELYSSGRR